MAVVTSVPPNRIRPCIRMEGWAGVWNLKTKLSEHDREGRRVERTRWNVISEGRNTNRSRNNIRMRQGRIGFESDAFKSLELSPDSRNGCAKLSIGTSPDSLQPHRTEAGRVKAPGNRRRKHNHRNSPTGRDTDFTAEAFRL